MSKMSEKTPNITVQTSAPNSPADTMTLFECPYGYHFPSSPTPSMLSELARAVQKSATTGAKTKPNASQTLPYVKSRINLPKLTSRADEEDLIKRMAAAFPTAPAPIIEQTVRAYHGREGLIKAMLISLGYKRSTEYGSQQATAQSPIMLMMVKPSSKKLFDKLVGYFPDKDESLIKSLMYKLNEVEHEVISALVEDGSESSAITPHRDSGGEKTRFETNGAIMKLRYLKFLYPTCEEIEIYHLLHCNDLNAQKVMEIVERRGHKKSNINDVLEKRKSQTQQIRAQKAAQAAKVEAPTTTNLLEAHQRRAVPAPPEPKLNPMLEKLKQAFPAKPEGVILNALKATEYKEEVALKFLEQHEDPDMSAYEQEFQFHRAEKSPVVLFPCKSVQKGDSSFMSVTGYESLAIAKEVIECTTALALIKVDASSFTGDDFQLERPTQARGKCPNLAHGPKSRLESHSVAHRQPLRRGQNEELRCGSNYKQLCATDELQRPKPNSKATGRNKSLDRGPEASRRCGHNAKLLTRIHPFFQQQEPTTRPYGSAS